MAGCQDGGPGKMSVFCAFFFFFFLLTWLAIGVYTTDWEWETGNGMGMHNIDSIIHMCIES